MATRKAKARKNPGLSEHFVRGLVAASCLSAFQDAPRPASAKAVKRILRHALQGGTALAAGSLAAELLGRRNYAGALLAAASGAAGVLLIEQLLRDNAQSNQER